MFEALTRLFSKPEPDMADHDPKIATAALLVHLAAVDGQVTAAERTAIKQGLMDNYAIGDAEVENLIKEAAKRDAEAVDFYRFTSAINRLEPDEKRDIIEMMWRVVFTDSENHELEDNMVWRVAELIGVSSRERTILRSRIAKSQGAG